MISPLRRAYTTGNREGGSVLAAIFFFCRSKDYRVQAFIDAATLLNLARPFELFIANTVNNFY